MKKAIIFICLIMLIAGCVAVAGCGSGGDNEKSVKSTEPEDGAEESESESDVSNSGLEGRYVLEIDGDFMAAVTLKADNEATYSLTEDGGIPVTYKVNGDTVVLVGLDGQEISTGTFKITDEGLVDPTGGLYKKQ